MGAFNNYVDRILPMFDPPLRGQFLYPEHGQKQTFFDLLPPTLLPVLITIVFFFKGFLVRFLKIFCRIQLLSLAFDTLRIGNLFEFPHVGFTAEVVLQ